jgi:hypothetical protein
LVLLVLSDSPQQIANQNDAHFEPRSLRTVTVRVSLPGITDQDALKSRSSAWRVKSASRKESSKEVKEKAKGRRRDFVHKSVKEGSRDLLGKKRRREDPKGSVEKILSPAVRVPNSDEHWSVSTTTDDCNSLSPLYSKKADAKDDGTGRTCTNSEWEKEGGELMRAREE